MKNLTLRVQDIKQLINNKVLADFDGSESSYWINYKKPLSHPPENIEQALSARRLAVEINYKDDEKYYQAQWQRYWLSCCLSSKCDYIFAVLKECDIDRERDIMKLWKDGILWGYLGSDFGKNYYNDICMRFLLRRYNWYGAFQLWWKYNRSSFSGINLLLPRLIGTIILGFAFLITSDKILEFPLKLMVDYPFKYWLLFGLSLFVSWIYLLIECRNTTGKFFITRPSLIFIWGLIISLFLSFGIFQLFAQIFSSGVVGWEGKLLFSSLSLFIGIFIQVFWEEKTITEPL